MRTAFITLALGLIYIAVSIARGWGYPVPSHVVALISIIAAMFSLQDLLNELGKYRNSQKVVLGLILLFLILSFLLWLFPIQLDKKQQGYLQTGGDAATIFGLGVVILMIGLKDIKDYKALTSKHSFDINVVRKMVTQEYHSMMEINDIITKLKDNDRITIPQNRVHNGWSLLFDFLVDHRNGPFYDGLNTQLFSNFIKKLDDATEIITNIADPEPPYIRDMGTIEMWGLVEIYSQPCTFYKKGPVLTDVIIELTSAIQIWDQLKENIIKQYENYGLR